MKQNIEKQDKRKKDVIYFSNIEKEYNVNNKLAKSNTATWLNIEKSNGGGELVYGYDPFYSLIDKMWKYIEFIKKESTISEETKEKLKLEILYLLTSRLQEVVKNVTSSVIYNGYFHYIIKYTNPGHLIFPSLRNFIIPEELNCKSDEVLNTMICIKTHFMQIIANNVYTNIISNIYNIISINDEGESRSVFSFNGKEFLKEMCSLLKINFDSISPETYMDASSNLLLELAHDDVSKIDNIIEINVMNTLFHSTNLINVIEKL